MVASSFLLTYAFLMFRIVARHEYLDKGKLSPVSTFFQALVWFLFGGFPYIYGPHDWPEVHINLTVAIFAWIFLWGGLALMLIGIASLGLSQALGRKSSILKKAGFYGLKRHHKPNRL
jgi:hypothetical protein